MKVVGELGKQKGSSKEMMLTRENESEKWKDQNELVRYLKEKEGTDEQKVQEGAEKGYLTSRGPQMRRQDAWAQWCQQGPLRPTESQGK